MVSCSCVFCIEIVKFSSTMCCSVPRRLWDRSSPAQNGTSRSFIGRWSLHHWTTGTSQLVFMELFPLWAYLSTLQPFCSWLGSIHWKDWRWSWSSHTSSTWCKELTHWKRLWYWEKLRAKEEGGNRGWNGWMASPTQWTWVWASSGRWRRTGKPGVLQSMRWQRVGHDLLTEQQQNKLPVYYASFIFFLYKFLFI